MSRNGSRFTSIHLLKLLQSLAATRTEMVRVGVRLEVMDDMQEQIIHTLLSINGIKAETAGTLYLSLEDWLSGMIDDHVMLGLLAGSGRNSTAKLWRIRR